MDKSKNIVNSKIGERIKRYRTERKMSRNELADLLGVSFSTISKYEQGDREPSISTLIEISKILDISIMKFLDSDILFAENSHESLADFIINTDKTDLLIKSILQNNLYLNKRLSNLGFDTKRNSISVDFNTKDDSAISKISTGLNALFDIYLHTLPNNTILNLSVDDFTHIFNIVNESTSNVIYEILRLIKSKGDD